MRTLLTEMTVCGFKSINKPVTIQFTNKGLDKTIFDKPLVKAIYGTNGEGKSAIVHAIDVYTKTIINKDYLTVESANGALGEIINKKLKKASVNVKYITIPELPNMDGSKSDDAYMFDHTLNYSCDDGRISITNERLLVNFSFAGDSDKAVLVYEIKDGDIKELNKVLFDGYEQKILDKTKNLLNRTSLLSFLLEFFAETLKQNTINDKKGLFGYLSFFAILFDTLTKIYLDEKDSHKIKIDEIDEIVKKAGKVDKNTFKFNDISIDYEAINIEEKQLDNYKKEIKKVTKFLRIFKPNLKRIDLDVSPVGNGKVRCKKLLVYDDGNVVSSEYESSGIKKLMKLYPVLAILEYGGIAFIDEFDSNIHDVYLCKIIEYALNYTRGQLIFTTHNLGPMEVLDKSGIKHSIDFINNSKISSWKRNGNYSVVKVYRGGAIPNCPFNIDAADFVKVFGEAEGK